jgi:hypothetical protein
MKNKFYNKGQGLVAVIVFLTIIGLTGGIVWYFLFRPLEKETEWAKTLEFPQAANSPSKEPTKEEQKSEGVQPGKITPPPQELPKQEKPTEKPTSQTIQNKVPESNIVVIEDDGSVIARGVQSDRGIMDILVSSSAAMKKFLQDYPLASNQYDFAVIFSTFNSSAKNIGFAQTKKLDAGISDFPSYSIDKIDKETNLTGKEKIRGFAYIFQDLLSDDFSESSSSFLGDIFWLLIHEISHTWIFFLGDGGTCDKAFNCTKETGFKIRDVNLAHYGDKVKTTTKEGNSIYMDPNSAGSGLVPNSDNPGYCLDFGTGGVKKYKFITMSLYLMGLIPPEQVIPLKWYETNGEWSDKGIPCVEKTFSAQDVINLVGPRNPSYPNTQKDFSVVYILLTEKGKKPTDAQVKKMDYIAENFPIRWNEATNYKSTINGKGIIR